MSKQLYHLANVRDLLLNGFDDRDLRRLCYDVPDFRPVYNHLASGTGKAEIVDELLQYAEKQLLMDTLLALAREQNLARFEHHGPYYSDDPTPALQKQVSDLAMRVAELTAPSALTRDDHYRIALHWADLGRKDSLRMFDLEGRDLRAVDLEGADLRAANLKAARLNSANLTLADLRAADLVGADLSNAQLGKAKLKGANLAKANLNGAGLFAADLPGAHLRSATLEGAWLERANLRGADLSYAKLNGANLTEAELTFAILDNAELHNASVTREQLESTRARFHIAPHITAFH